MDVTKFKKSASGNMLETRKSGIKKINVNFSFEFSQNCSKANGNMIICYRGIKLYGKHY